METETVQHNTFSFNWILTKDKDLLFYIGSALIGYLYLAIIFYAILTLKNPLTDSFASFTLGTFILSFNLELLVVVSWGLFLDAPHLFATLGRTFFDPDEWNTRKPELLKSWLFFFLGPIMILLPYGSADVLHVSMGIDISIKLLVYGSILFLIFFRLWAYYHVVRQHWGFVALYKRKNNDFSPESYVKDKWVFRVVMYGPLLLFLTAPWYGIGPLATAFPPLPLSIPLFIGISLAMILYPIIWFVYLLTVIYYIIYQFILYRQGVQLNGAKLIYLSLIIPLHLLAFSHPIVALFVTPLVTVGHNIQYHMIVYDYAQKKYYKNATAENSYLWTRFIFKNIAIYAIMGLIFTLLLYRGPWIDFIEATTGIALNNVLFNSVGMMAGITDPASLDLGTQVFASFLLGWAMQHYYLDSKIWRVSKDKNLAKVLQVS